MGMLARVFSSFVTSTPVPAPAADSEDGTPEPPAAEPVPPAEPAWKSLVAITGVQSAEYPDAPRLEVRPLFAHTPRRVLDIGCATGAVGWALKQDLGCWVWGCELDAAAAVRAAQRLDRLSTRPSAQWSEEELAELRTIDTVLLLDVLEHMYNPWAELQFLARHLAPGAQVIVSLPNAGNIHIVAQLASGQFSYEPAGVLDVTHIRFFTHREMLKMFEETGFEAETATVLSATPAGAPLTTFPAQVSFGKFSLTVESEMEWNILHAYQLGFRLRTKQA